MPAPAGQPALISTTTSPACIRSSALVRVWAKIFFRRALLVLPKVSQMTRGGGPNFSSKLTKSLSLVIRIASASLAAKKISRSPESRSPKSRTATADTANCALIQGARAGDNWRPARSSCCQHRVVQPKRCIAKRCLQVLYLEIRHLGQYLFRAQACRE